MHDHKRKLLALRKKRKKQTRLRPESALVADNRVTKKPTPRRTDIPSGAERRQFICESPITDWLALGDDLGHYLDCVPTSLLTTIVCNLGIDDRLLLANLGKSRLQEIAFHSVVSYFFPKDNQQRREFLWFESRQLAVLRDLRANQLDALGPKIDVPSEPTGNPEFPGGIESWRYQID